MIKKQPKPVTQRTQRTAEFWEARPADWKVSGRGRLFLDRMNRMGRMDRMDKRPRQPVFHSVHSPHSVHSVKKRESRLREHAWCLDGLRCLCGSLRSLRSFLSPFGCGGAEVSCDGFHVFHCRVFTCAIAFQSSESASRSHKVDARHKPSQRR